MSSNSAGRVSRFLEPVYLNERMVLNCAAYLFRGVITETTSIAEMHQERTLGASLRVPFLGDFLGVSAEGSNITSEQQTAQRTFLTGGLHMNVLDELKTRQMIAEISTPTPERIQGPTILDRYIDITAQLQPTNYFSLLELVARSGPLVSNVAENFSKQFFGGSGSGADDIEAKKSKTIETAKGLVQAAQILLNDYLTSGTVEMVMADDNGKQIGIVDLEVAPDDAKRVVARLAGGRYHVIGKVTSRTITNGKMSLLQRTMMYEIVEIGTRFKALMEEIKRLRPNDAKAQDFLKTFDSVASNASLVQQIMQLQIPGPAIRIAAMSVCV